MVERKNDRNEFEKKLQKRNLNIDSQEGKGLI